MNNVCLFDTPLRSKEFRKGLYAHQYRNGVINICGEKYLCCSMTEAIAMYRKKFPSRKIGFRNEQ